MYYISMKINRAYCIAKYAVLGMDIKRIVAINYNQWSVHNVIKIGKSVQYSTDKQKMCFLELVAIRSEI